VGLGAGVVAGAGTIPTTANGIILTADGGAYSYGYGGGGYGYGYRTTRTVVTSNGNGYRYWTRRLGINPQYNDTRPDPESLRSCNEGCHGLAIAMDLVTASLVPKRGAQSGAYEQDHDSAG
jgi:hypothetical protein